ncbi:hypothetical protein HN018_24190 (plasmid) [Lichenicola cladoniae]|uniref:Uncharacterized protein n=1 Tax=Lichenicola cladoniae TaxID=1484109 RepID=A0A6M8HXN3_9PROT|nr:hypothetical protein [Lichenicola cladoniae]NPD70287.1 hypothetical protein [Acetobacteraceae bacterium]QKE93314.1 hypothetical protein HN018_24190 [Lichenicola cladoniae]
MKQVLTATLHVIGGLAVAMVLAAVVVAPGFLSGSSSMIHLPTIAEIASR